MGKGKGKSGGGGGTSGKIGYPVYIETFHGEWLQSMDMAMTTAQGSNPYELAEAYEAEDNITSMDTAIMEFSDVLGPSVLYDIAGNFETYGNLAVAYADKIDSTASKENTAASIAARSLEIDDDVYEALSRFHAGMVDINAVVGTAFVLGTAWLNMQGVREKNKYAAEIKRDTFKYKYTNISSALATLMQADISVLQARKELAGLKIEKERMAIVAGKEQIEADIEYDVKSIMWDIDTIQEAASILGTPGGAVAGSGERGLSRGQSVLGGALSGASAGALAGGPGAGWGAILGGIGGLF